MSGNGDSLDFLSVAPYDGHNASPNGSLISSLAECGSPP
jgi:hypothetical protein